MVHCTALTAIHCMQATLVKTYGSTPTSAGIAFKRIAPCRPIISNSTRNSPTKTGETCSSVYKAGVCIDCKPIKNPCDWKEYWADADALFTPDTQKYLRDLAHISGKKQGHAKKYWFAAIGGVFQGTGAQEYGCVPEMWFRNMYFDKGPEGKGNEIGSINPGSPKNPISMPDAEYKNWAKHCLPAAFDPATKQLRPEFQCSDADQFKFKETLKAF